MTSLCESEPCRGAHAALLMLLKAHAYARVTAGGHLVSEDFVTWTWLPRAQFVCVCVWSECAHLFLFWVGALPCCTAIAPITFF